MAGLDPARFVAAQSSYIVQDGPAGIGDDTRLGSVRASTTPKHSRILRPQRLHQNPIPARASLARPIDIRERYPGDFGVAALRGAAQQIFRYRLAFQYSRRQRALASARQQALGQFPLVEDADGNRVTASSRAVHHRRRQRLQPRQPLRQRHLIGWHTAHDASRLLVEGLT